MKVLIADDDVQLVRALAVTLAARGYDVVTARDGRAAIDAVITERPDLVPVLGPVHGALYVALVLLVLVCLPRLRWAPWFTLVMLTVGSPGAHFAVRATRAS